MGLENEILTRIRKVNASYSTEIWQQIVYGGLAVVLFLWGGDNGVIVGMMMLLMARLCSIEEEIKRSKL